MIIRPSRKKFLNVYATAALLPSLIPFVNSGLYTLTSVIISAGLLLKAEISRVRVKYTFTSTELTQEVGIFRKSISNTRILRIAQMSVEQGIIQKLLDYGSVHLDTWGQAIDFKDISKPHLIVERIKEMQKDNEL